jgi:hypothetical protein
MNISRIIPVVLLICQAALAEGYFGFNGGMAWPQALRGVEGVGSHTAWKAGIEWGGTIQERIALGGSFGLLWKRVADDTISDSIHDPYGGTIQQYEVNRSISRVLLPLEGTLSIDLVPELPVRPVLRCAGGPAMMVYLNRHLKDEYQSESELSEQSGVYWGMIGRVGADLMIRLGEESDLYFGAEYQWSQLSKHKWGTNIRYRQDMSGPAIRIGVRIL